MKRKELVVLTIARRNPKVSCLINEDSGKITQAFCSNEYEILEQAKLTDGRETLTPKAVLERAGWRYTGLLGSGMNQLPGAMGRLYILTEIWLHTCAVY